VLHQQQCQIITSGTPAIHADSIQQLLSQLSEYWQIDSAGKSISRRFEFTDYYHTMAFVNAVAWIAQQQDHHPELHVSYKTCDVSYTTHSIDGLSLNDFICAAHTDHLQANEVRNSPWPNVT